ncbi:MAG: site-specific DNA-methyltransferase [Pseudomonadota bacterium]|nr:site-specific DNA-methyltransferase [Pseudomonadota bacterium]
MPRPPRPSRAKRLPDDPPAAAGDTPGPVSPASACPAPTRPGRALLVEDDCLRALRHIPSGAVQLILCDLPYGTTRNPWDSVLPLEALWAEYRRVLAPRGVVVLTAQGPFTARVILSQEALFRFKLVWVKSKSTNFLNAKRQPLRRHEDVCVFYKSQPAYTPQMHEGAAYDKGVRKDQLTGSYGDFRPVQVRSEGGRYPTDVLYFKTAEAEGPVWHPTQKPVALGRYLVRTWSAPGDLVLDNAFGAGSFVVAAVAEGRRALGIELNEGGQAFKRGDVDLVGVTAARLAADCPTAPVEVLRRGGEDAERIGRWIAAG